MTGKVLVGYATKAGSTAEVAQAIAEVLRSKGDTVDVMPVKAAKSVEGDWHNWDEIRAWAAQAVPDG